LTGELHRTTGGARRFGELRSLLHGEPSQIAWEEICELVDGWDSAAELREVVLPYALRAMVGWPDELRAPPPHAREAIIAGNPTPSVALCVELSLAYSYFLVNQRMTNRSLSALAQSEWVGWSVESLELTSHPIGDSGILSLAESRWLGNLRSIKLGYTCVSHEGLRALICAPRLERLYELVASNLDLTDEVLEAVSAGGARERLRVLDLSSNKLTSRGVRALARSRAARRLEVLDLSFNQLTDEAAFELANSEHVRGVRRLVLDYNDISLSGWRALVHSPNFRGAQISCYPTR